MVFVLFICLLGLSIFSNELRSLYRQTVNCLRRVDTVDSTACPQPTCFMKIPELRVTKIKDVIDCRFMLGR